MEVRGGASLEDKASAGGVVTHQAGSPQGPAAPRGVGTSCPVQRRFSSCLLVPGARACQDKRAASHLAPNGVLTAPSTKLCPQDQGPLEGMRSSCPPTG